MQSSSKIIGNIPKKIFSLNLAMWMNISFLKTLIKKFPTILIVPWRHVSLDKYHAQC